MVLGGLGACPQGILNTFKFPSLFSSLTYGALVDCTVVLHKIKCALNCVSSINEAKKQADLKSTIQQNEPLRGKTGM